MRLEGTLIRSRVGRRILMLFVLCALLPVGIALVVTFLQVDRRMSLERRERLRHQSKLASEQVLERIRLIEADLSRTLRGIEGSPRDGWEAALDSASSRLAGLAVEPALGEVLILFGSPAFPPPLTTAVRERLDGGGSVLATVPDEEGRSDVLIIRQVDLGEGPVLAWAAVDTERLAAETTAFSSTTNLCLLDTEQFPIFCPLTLPEGLLPATGELRRSAQDAHLEWRDGDIEHVGAYSLVFLSYDYASPPWMVVAGETDSPVLSRLSDFRLSVFLACAGGLCIVLLLSSVQIRRNLDPLSRLQEGTRRVAEGNLAARVDVDSSDEFGDLADSFNDMTFQLERQFMTLRTLHEIDRAVLTRPELREIATVSLRQARELTGCRSASLIVREAERASRSAVAFHDTGVDGTQESEGLRITLADEQRLRGRGLIDLDSSDALSCLGFAGLESRTLDLYAIGLEVQGEFQGLLVFGFAPGDDPAHLVGDIEQVADQVAVALGNVFLVAALDRMSEGALRTLAYAVDAKSRWTAGHSERVTRIACALADVMALDADDRERLHRGGLLHDLGKMGISEEILDSPERLTDEQYARIQEHPEIGARILQPIEAFADILPIVLYHHERWDGGGYPSGLAREGIPFLARVLAVADVYDALTSDRPYRAAMSVERALEIIEGDSGTHFDPEIVPHLRPALARLGDEGVDVPLAVGAGG